MIKTGTRRNRKLEQALTGKKVEFIIKRQLTMKIPEPAIFAGKLL